MQEMVSTCSSGWRRALARLLRRHVLPRIPNKGGQRCSCELLASKKQERSLPCRGASLGSGAPPEYALSGAGLLVPHGGPRFGVRRQAGARASVFLVLFTRHGTWMGFS